MTKLLVSVRDAAEAELARAAGVDLIDLKEPTKGALGAVDFAAARSLAEQWTLDRPPLSMALGELVDYFPADFPIAGPAADDDVPREDRRFTLPDVPEAISFVKLGLSGCARRTHWRSQLQLLRRSFDPNIGFVAVVFADGDAVDAPPVEAIVAEAIKLEAAAVLVDTAVKDGRTLFDHWSPAQLRRLIDEVQSLGMAAVVGGGLTLTVIPQVVTSGADYVAVRGAACAAGRETALDAERIRAIQKLLPRETTLG